MAVGANSYGTVAEVAALTRMYTNAGSYDATTNPTQTSVEKFIDNISASVNVALAKAGFAIPVTQTDAKAAIASMVIEAAADLCHAANSAGRFFTERAVERGVNPMAAIRKEAAGWVEEMAAGLEALGAGRTSGSALSFGYRGTDQSGESVAPLFERKGYGERSREWDR